MKNEIKKSSSLEKWSEFSLVPTIDTIILFQFCKSKRQNVKKKKKKVCETNVASFKNSPPIFESSECETSRCTRRGRVWARTFIFHLLRGGITRRPRRSDHFLLIRASLGRRGKTRDKRSRLKKDPRPRRNSDARISTRDTIYRGRVCPNVKNPNVSAMRSADA